MTTLVTIVGERDIPGQVPTAGPVGRHLVDRLVAAGQSVRVLTPAPEADGWPAEVEVVVGDVARPDATPEAFTGVRRLFLSGADPETAHALMRRARDGGVTHVVLLTSHGPEFEIEYGPEAWHWLAVEVVVERSGARWTHLCPAPVMAHQTLGAGYSFTGTPWADAIRRGETVRELHADARYPLIHEDDLAEVAAVLLTADRYTGQRVTVHGTPVSPREQIADIARALQRPVAFEEVSRAEATERDRRAGVPEETIELAHTADPEPVGTDDTLARLLDRPPRTYADWVATHLDAFGRTPEPLTDPASPVPAHP